jgi:hypothetical protein
MLQESNILGSSTKNMLVDNEATLEKYLQVQNAVLFIARMKLPLK